MTNSGSREHVSFGVTSARVSHLETLCNRVCRTRWRECQGSRLSLPSSFRWWLRRHLILYTVNQIKISTWRSRHMFLNPDQTPDSYPFPFFLAGVRLWQLHLSFEWRDFQIKHFRPRRRSLSILDIRQQTFGSFIPLQNPTSLHNLRTTTSRTMATEIKIYHGNCHCGLFQYQLEIPEITTVESCKCSFCLKVS